MITKVAIHSVPRSGSSWLGSIFDSHPGVCYKFQPLFSYALKGALNNKSSKGEIDDFFKRLSSTEDDFIDQVKAKEEGIVPIFPKSELKAVAYKEVRYHHIIENLLNKSDDLKVIGLVRNPMAVIHSWWNAPKEFKKDQGWKLEDEWQYAPSKNLNRIEEFNGYQKWKEVALLFERLKNEYPDQFRVEKYIDLINNSELVIKNLFDFANLDFDIQTKDFLIQSTNKLIDDPYGVYKNKVDDDDWKDNLPTPIVDYIFNDLKNTELEHLI